MDARAYWITRDTILYESALLEKASLTLAGQSLSFDPAGPGEAIRQKYPHLKNYAAYHLPLAMQSKAQEMLKSSLIVALRDADGRLTDSTGLQIAGVLDDIYPYDGPLGITFEDRTPTLRVWAPTAGAVKLHLCSSPDDTDELVLPMTNDPLTGVWSITGHTNWYGRYYRYGVEVYVPASRKIEYNLVTDPYSISLSTNSRFSQIMDLSDPALQPAGWGELRIPPIAAPEDMVIYELHVRDFSMSDETVPRELRGTYRAFTLPHSYGMRHLRALAAAGLTHLHLLPVFDFSTVDDNRSAWKSVDMAVLRALSPDSEWQAHAVDTIKNVDGYNWGYDPYHFMVPEGSYSTDPQGPARIREFREMVLSLNCIGLWVVMDVVFNHTNAYGQSEKSVLDRIVPGYYHRRNARGEVETSSCCPNTATEHAMMRKLMIDSIITWAKAYKVSGFRFDLMGHHMKADIEAVRDALDALTPAKDGVSGRKIYVYGEAWDFGEVGGNSRGINASQQNIGGTGIGSFNDRLRDAVRGGAPFDHPQLQGFVTGLYCDPNDYYQGEWWEQHQKLLTQSDWVRLSLAGNLRNFQLMNAQGHTVIGRQLEYRGGPAGYTLDPGECVNYVSAHDNETLFDAIQLKASPRTPLAARVRMQAVALSLVVLGQGIPFIHAGDDLLRSKSLDRNSFNSGDWFNALDFSRRTSNWGVGLPPGENSQRWDMLRPLLGNQALKPRPFEIQWMAEYFRELLRIRKNTPLFRLRTEQQVQDCLSFLNTGPEQIPGLIVMCLKSPLTKDAQAPTTTLGATSQPAEGAQATTSNPGVISQPSEGAKSPTTNPGVSLPLIDGPETRPTTLTVPPSIRETSPTLPRGAKALSSINQVIVFFNAAPGAVTFTDSSLVGLDIALHPLQAASVDDQVRATRYDRNAGVFTIPGRTTVVYVVEESES